MTAGRQGVEEQARARHPPEGEPAPGIGDEVVHGLEPRRVVAVTEQGGHASRAATGAPGPQACASTSEPAGRHTSWSVPTPSGVCAARVTERSAPQRIVGSPAPRRKTPSCARRWISRSVRQTRRSAVVDRVAEVSSGSATLTSSPRLGTIAAGRSLDARHRPDPAVQLTCPWTRNEERWPARRAETDASAWPPCRPPRRRPNAVGSSS